MSRDDDVRRRDGRLRRRHAGDLQRDGARAGDRLRDRRRRAGRAVVCALDAQPRGRQRIRVRAPERRDASTASRASTTRRTRSSSRSTGSTRTRTTSRCSPAAASRTVTRRWTSGLPTKGTGKYEWRGFLSQGRAPARHRAEGRHARQLEQQAGSGLAGRGRPVGLRLGDSQRAARVPPRTSWPTHTLASTVGSMNYAATQDLRIAQAFRGIDAVLADRRRAQRPRAADVRAAA